MLSESAPAIIARTVASIGPPDAVATDEANRRQAQLAKPQGSLGRLEVLAAQIAGITGRARPRLERRLIVVAAGDHGVARRGVSAYPPEVTAQMVATLLGGGAAVNVLARLSGARVRIVDAGVTGCVPAHGELARLRLGQGTADITQRPAMSRAAAEEAIAAGIALLEGEIGSEGVDLVACGEMGIGNSTAAAAVIATLTGREPREVTGRGTGVDAAGLERKVDAVKRALAVNRPDATDATGVLAGVGGFEIGVLVGVYLAAAAHRVPAVVDGVISGAAALLADALAPSVRPYLIAGHRSAEPGQEAVLAQLGLEPLLDLGMRLGEGSGAALAMTVCVAACRLLDEMATFEEAGIASAEGAERPA